MDLVYPNPNIYPVLLCADDRAVLEEVHRDNEAKRDLMLESTIAGIFDACRTINDKMLGLHRYATALHGYMEDADEVYRLLCC